MTLTSHPWCGCGLDFSTPCLFQPLLPRLTTSDCNSIPAITRHKSTCLSLPSLYSVSRQSHLPLKFLSTCHRMPLRLVVDFFSLSSRTGRKLPRHPSLNLPRHHDMDFLKIEFWQSCQLTWIMLLMSLEHINCIASIALRINIMIHHPTMPSRPVPCHSFGGLVRQTGPSLSLDHVQSRHKRDRPGAPEIFITHFDA